MGEMGKAGRDKYWSELDTEEKCKRLREQVKTLQRHQREMAIMLRKPSDHSHDGGKVMVPLYDPCGGEPIRQPTGDDVYF